MQKISLDPQKKEKLIVHETESAQSEQSSDQTANKLPVKADKQSVGYSMNNIKLYII